MLPSLLARDVQNGLKQFLLHDFEASDDFFHGLMQRFVDEESAWMKGDIYNDTLPVEPRPAWFSGQGVARRFLHGSLGRAMLQTPFRCASPAGLLQRNKRENPWCRAGWPAIVRQADGFIGTLSTEPPAAPVNQRTVIWSNTPPSAKCAFCAFCQPPNTASTVTSLTLANCFSYFFATTGSIGR